MERLANFILRVYPIDYVPLKRRVTFHLLFWGIYFCILLIGVGVPSDNIIYRFLAAVSLIITSSAFFYEFAYLTPYAFVKYERFNKVLVVFLLIIAFYFFVAFETYTRVFFVMKNQWIISQNKRMYEIYCNAYKSGFWSYLQINNILTDTIQLILIAVPAFFLKFTRIFAKNLSEKKQLEIDFLRLQINPHFLVNTLNNIYGLVVTEDQRSSNAILSLSNLLNYVLYESSLPTVSLEKEITFLQNFVALEKIRSQSEARVNMKVMGELVGDVAPLILIAFIENAFKHSSGDATTPNFINIDVTVEQNTLTLNVVNSHVKETSKKTKKTLGGIGFVNVQKRLASLYPHRHSLQVITAPCTYQISLKIQLTQK